MSAKTFNTDLLVLGSVTANGIATPSGGSVNEYFRTDGTVGEVPSQAVLEDGIKYFAAAYKDGLTFVVTAEWRMNGILYTLRQTEITLDAADPTFGRLDVIVLDSSGVISKITGTPSATPAKPTVDPTNQFEGTFVSIPAGATTPEGTAVYSMYYENLGTGGGEWNITHINGRTVSSATTPISGTVSLNGTSCINGDGIIFTPAAPINTADVKQLNYIIQNKAATAGKGETHRFILSGLDGASNAVTVAVAADPTYNLQSLTPQFLSLQMPSNSVIFTINSIKLSIVAKSAYGFIMDEVRLVQVDTTQVSGNWATVEYVDQVTTFNAGKEILSGVVTGTTEKTMTLTKSNNQTVVVTWTEAGAGGGVTESQLINTSRQFNNQQTSAQKTLTDAATLSWDFDTQQVAILTATGAVGNLRTLPNSIIAAAQNGGTYQLTFVQDATGGRKLFFESGFKVIGRFDTAPNKRTLITLVKQGAEMDVILSPILDPEQPQTLTGNTLNLSNYFSHSYNWLIGDTKNYLSYLTEQLSVQGCASVLINAASEPVIYETDGTTPATKIEGYPFTPSVQMELIVRSMDGLTVQYYFQKLL